MTDKTYIKDSLEGDIRKHGRVRMYIEGVAEAGFSYGDHLSARKVIDRIRIVSYRVEWDARAREDNDD